MTEQRPTNEHIAELLRELVQEVREVKRGQTQLATDLRNLADAFRR